MTRVAVVAGCRTSFAKAGTKLSQYSSLDLGKHVVCELIKNFQLNPETIDELVYSTVLLNTRFPNLAREIVLRTDLPNSLIAHFVSNNCISGLVAINMIAEGIRSNRIKIGIAGGGESMSRPALAVNKKTEKIFIAASRERSLSGKLKQLLKLRPAMLLPQAPSPKEPSTGLTMGQHAEITAQEFGISREDQDQFAFDSHQKASYAQSRGLLGSEIVPMNGVDQDNLIRSDTTVEKLAGLRPVFDRSEKGTITAGNASALTDGASAVCLMAEEIAKEQKREILGYIEAVQYAAVSPEDGLLMAPAIALPTLLQRNSLTVDQVDLFEVHEAFSAQVLTNMAAWENGWSKYPDIKPIGKLPTEKVNVNGGSIAIGHPFAATGGRILTSLLYELQRRDKNTGVISVCAAGAMAAAVLVRRS